MAVSLSILVSFEIGYFWWQEQKANASNPQKIRANINDSFFKTKKNAFFFAKHEILTLAP